MHAAQQWTEIRPVQYGDPIPTGVEVEDRHVFVLDFSWPAAELSELHARCGFLRVLDHHATARRELEGQTFASFDEAECGATMALAYFRTELGETQQRFFSWLAAYVKDRDLWQHKLPDTKEVSAAIQTLGYEPRDYAAWIVFIRSGQRAAAEIGASVLRYRRIEIEAAKARARFARVRLGGWVAEVPIVNVSGKITSEVVGELAEGNLFAIGWWELATGEVVLSLRAPMGGLPVHDIAGGEGGGGHPRAAGCTVESLEALLGKVDFIDTPADPTGRRAYTPANGRHV